MHRNPSRPLSPHLTIWRWGPHMLVSILHRVTGVGLSTLGALAFVWWLVAAATGADAYADFVAVARSWIGVIVGVGLSWALFQHTLSGMRHFVMDIGAGYDLKTNKFWATMTIVGSLFLTALLWFFLLVEI
ncbi:MAG: succinate dehydrogenase, cytochrome b556 subunit [Pseudomonadota bacterium]|nr:succinate dehydrogenase, cytochrome b556 subunit [Pseudomonadota bacterium]